MKKIRILLMVFIVALLLIPCNILAAGSPISLFKITEQVTGISPYFLSNEKLERGQEYKFYNITFGNAFIHYHLNYIDYEFDENIFEFVDFKSDYGFEYNNGKITLKDNKSLSEFYISNSPSLLWTFHLRVKEDAKLVNTNVGVTSSLVEHNAKSYTIVCADYDNSSECNLNENTNNQTQKPNDNNIPESNVNDNNNNQNQNNNNIPESNVNDNNNNQNQNNNNIPESNENDNNNENQNTNTPIKEETSIFDKKSNLNLYVLLTLFAIISIELLVLIIMVINNSRKRRNSKV